MSDLYYRYYNGADGSRARHPLDYKSPTLDIGDEYHTMNDLYDMRLALTVALFKAYDSYITPLNSAVRCWKSKLHSDGTMFDGGYFIVGMTIKPLDITKPDTFITFHYKMEHWNLFNIIELDRAPEWDGHDDKVVMERLMRL